MSRNQAAEETTRQLKELCSRMLPELQRQLSGCIHAHEPEFLRLGEQLQQYAGQVRELGSMAGGVLDSMAGQDMGELIQGFHQELGVMAEVCGSQAAGEALQDLHTILETIAGLEELMREFGRLVRHLQMLGISTRIESARLGAEGRGFHTLADDVEKLAQRIDGHSTMISNQARSLTEHSRLAIQQTAAMRDKQEQCSISIFTDIRQNLDTLSGLVRRSEELGHTLARNSGTIQQSIGEVVSSLQFHDIVRQQVEHVEEALHDIATVLKEGQFGGQQPEEADLAGWISDVVHLQRRQVRNGAERFVQAVEALKSHLEDVADNILDMQRGITELLGRDVRGGSGTLLHIEATVDGMLETMQTFAHQGEEIGRTMGSVAGTIAEISQYLGDIEEVGAEIELIALNASIKAAHTGEQGAAMGVLAMSVQQLSKEASLQTEEVARVLRKVAEAADMLGSRAAAFLDTSQVQGMVTALKGLLHRLKELDGVVAAGFGRLSGQSAQLGESIRRTNAGIGFHQQAATLLNKAEEKLVLLESRAAELAPEGDERQRPERLRALLERYTMDAERLVHQELLQDPHIAVGKQESGGGDWDNVELF